MTEEIIKVNNISFTYPDSKLPALKDITFSINKGEWVSIVGHNGSGKSTLSKLLNGLLVAENIKDSSIFVDSLEMNEQNVWKIRDKLGIVFQNPDNQFVGATVGDDVAFGLENRNVSRKKMLQIIPKVLQQVSMLSYKNVEPQNLSGGQKQRVAIAGILAIDPKIIILDEATSMLDPEGRKEILNIIKNIQKEKNMTVLSITHNIDEISHSDRVLVLNKGTLLKNTTPSKVFADSELVKKSGLEVPFYHKLISELVNLGLAIPSNINNKEGLLDYLCQLNLNM